MAGGIRRYASTAWNNRAPEFTGRIHHSRTVTGYFVSDRVGVGVGAFRRLGEGSGGGVEKRGSFAT